MPALPDHVDTAIVGAGFGGLGAAIELDRAGFGDFAVIERAPEVGGTWWANTYPGCQCDVPSNLYSFSFARKPDWSRSYPEQPEILAYLRECSHKFGVRDRIHLDTELTGAQWDPDAQRWRIETSRGALTARVLVPAPGLLSEPKIPNLPGLNDFPGESFHSARWGEHRDLEGKRVAVIGTGASAIQIVPNIQPEVDKLLVYQRTPPWVAPLLDRPLGNRIKRIYDRFPAAQRAAREGVYWLREPMAIGMGLAPQLMKTWELYARANMRRQIPDPALREKLTPNYTIGCKRILLSNRWYPALVQPNVEVLTEGLAELRGSTLIGSEGSEREVDTIVWATGFSPIDPPIAHMLRDGAGRSLAEVWAGAPQAYLGTTVAGFPNMFLLYGPNTNLGHSSIVHMLESQFRYLLNAMRAMRDNDLAEIEVREDVQNTYNEDVQRRLKRTVWNSGKCASWYLDEDGENPIQWPDFTWRYRRLASRFDLGEHRTARAREPAAVGAGASSSSPAR